MRKIINIIAGKQIDLSNVLDLSKVKIKRIWTVYDEKRMWEFCKFNIQTGKPVKTLDDLTLRHHQGVFLEDILHDWYVRNGKLDFYPRTCEQGDPVKILIEYEE